ncbi:MAG: hypothetical protein HY381_00615 [Candidatus Chisholmbacteria bacterium]|nr:hypothetical protein [Candidatus Chisholmbacteria bacterium]
MAVIMVGVMGIVESSVVSVNLVAMTILAVLLVSGEERMVWLAVGGGVWADVLGLRSGLGLGMTSLGLWFLTGLTFLYQRWVGEVRWLTIVVSGLVWSSGLRWWEGELMVVGVVADVVSLGLILGGLRWMGQRWGENQKISLV